MLTSGISLLSHGNLANRVFKKKEETYSFFPTATEEWTLLAYKVISDKVVNWE